jgi:hypothetical protein
LTDIVKGRLCPFQRKHFPISNYLVVTRHLPQLLMDDEDSKADKMSSTLSNLNSLDVMDSISKEEFMGKTPFLGFKFDHL